MKDEILDTALTRFLQYGIREMSIQKLVEPLSISTKTLYRFFSNKEQLLEEALLLYYARQYEQLQNSAASQDPVHLLADVWTAAIEQAYRVNSVFFRDLHYYYPGLELKIERTIASKFSGELLNIIKKGIKEGDFRNDLLPEVLLESIFVLYTAVARGGQFKRYKVSPPHLLLNTIIVFMRGFCTPEGIRKLDNYCDITKEKKKLKGKKKETSFS